MAVAASAGLNARGAGAGQIVDEFPIALDFPPNIVNNHVIQVALDSFGIENFYLNAIFRVGT